MSVTKPGLTREYHYRTIIISLTPIYGLFDLIKVKSLLTLLTPRGRGGGCLTAHNEKRLVLLQSRSQGGANRVQLPPPPPPPPPRHYEYFVTCVFIVKESTHIVRPRRIDKSFHRFPMRRRVCSGSKKKKKKKKVNLILRRADNKPFSTVHLFLKFYFIILILEYTVTDIVTAKLLANMGRRIQVYNMMCAEI